VPNLEKKSGAQFRKKKKIKRKRRNEQKVSLQLDIHLVMSGNLTNMLSISF